MARDLRIGKQRDNRPYAPPPKAKASELLATVMAAPIDELAKEAVRQTVDGMCRRGEIIDDRKAGEA